VISGAVLRNFWTLAGRADSEGPLRAWLAEARAARWKSPAELKARYPKASLVGDRVVFNIGGNKYRLIVHINYSLGIVLIKFIGTHQEYDEVDVLTVGGRL